MRIWAGRPPGGVVLVGCRLGTLKTLGGEACKREMYDFATKWDNLLHLASTSSTVPRSPYPRWELSTIPPRPTIYFNRVELDPDLPLTRLPIHNSSVTALSYDGLSPVTITPFSTHFHCGRPRSESAQMRNEITSLLKPLVFEPGS
jgi:hypothetical protein